MCRQALARVGLTCCSNVEPTRLPSSRAGRLTSGISLPGFRFPFLVGEDGMADAPSVEHFSNLAAGLQWALLQPGDDSTGNAVAFPGWPCSWNVSFRLKAPAGATVSGTWSGGHLGSLDVDPPSRARHVLVAAGC